jgi:hypothetical protein
VLVDELNAFFVIFVPVIIVQVVFFIFFKLLTVVIVPHKLDFLWLLLFLRLTIGFSMIKVITSQQRSLTPCWLAAEIR